MKKTICLISFFLLFGLVACNQAHKLVVVQPEEEIDRAKIHNEAQNLLDEGDYDKIESRIQALQTSKEVYVNGFSKLAAFYSGLFRPNSNANDSSYENLITRLENWSEKSPNSIMPKIALARIFCDYAFKGLGSGFIDTNTITKEKLKIFDGRLAKARAALDLSWDQQNQSAAWYSAALRVALAQKVSRHDYEMIFQKAIQFDPDNIDFYFQKACYLTPVWCGKEGEVQNFIEDVAGLKKGENADIFYAQIVWSLRTSGIYGNIYDETGISWQRVKRGFQTLLSQHPHSIYIATEFCYEATQVGDRAQMRELYKNEIENKIVLSVWKTKERFIKFQTAAYSQQ